MGKLSRNLRTAAGDLFGAMLPLSVRALQREVQERLAKVPNELNEFGFEGRRDNEFRAIPGGANGGSNANGSARKPENAASGVQDDAKKEEAITGKTANQQNAELKAKEDHEKRQLSMSSGN